MADHDEDLEQVDDGYEEEYVAEEDVADGEVDIQRLSPDRQLDGFSKRPLVPVFILAIVIHVVVIGLSSLPWLISHFVPAAEAPEEEMVTPEDETVPSEEPTAQRPPLEVEGDDDPTPTETDLRDDPRVRNPEYIEQLEQAEMPPDDLLDDVGERLRMPD